jgi:undecaprenyl phosphate-alpha-L-ara4N flippase subunit ArnE
MPCYPEFTLIILAAFAVAAGHLSLKKSSLLACSQGGAISYLWALLGVIFLSMGPVAAIYVLRKVPLTLAIPLGSLVYILVPLGANLFFSEKLTRRFWAGLSLVLAGIIIVGLAKP